MADSANFPIPDMRFSWNETRPAHLTASPSRRTVLFDETLRDGIQAPYVATPSLKDKLAIVDFMARCGIKAADLGFPGSSSAAAGECAEIARYIDRNDYPIIPAFAGRTHEADVRAICDITQRTGIQVDAYVFTGVSPIRQYVEGWALETIIDRISASAAACERAGANFVLVLEDTMRCMRETLEQVYSAAVDIGVRRLTLCDTIGIATPAGTRALIEWTAGYFSRREHAVELEWHGHNDRGLALINSLTAASSGCARVHGTVLGVGERAGNSSLDQLIVNGFLEGDETHDLLAAREYCDYASQVLEIPIPGNYPAMGSEVFKTSAGVHAAAILKAHQAQHPALKDGVYSSIPARMLAREQEVLIDSASGMGNVKYWLAVRGLEVSASVAGEILDLAKSRSRPLDDDEIRSVIDHARH